MAIFHGSVFFGNSIILFNRSHSLIIILAKKKMTDKHVRFIRMSSNIGWTQEAPHPEMSWRKISSPIILNSFLEKYFHENHIFWSLSEIVSNPFLDLKVKLAPCWRICREVFPFRLLRYVNNPSSSQVDYCHWALATLKIEMFQS